MPKPNGENSEANDSEDTTVDQTDDTAQDDSAEDSSEDEADDSSEDVEETDDGEDEEDSEDTDSDSSDEEDEEADDVTKQYFTDPNSLDPRLRAAFKQMQGIYTRKMQAASRSVAKAEAFDNVMEIPGVRELVEGAAGGKTSSNGNEDESEDFEISDDKPLTVKTLTQILDKVVNSAIEKREIPKRRAAAERRFAKEADRFKKANPDWELYATDIRSILHKHPSLNYQDAYDLAKSKNSVRKTRLTAEEIKARKNSNVRKSSSVGSKKIQKEEKVSTIQQAAEKAMRMLNWPK